MARQASELTVAIRRLCDQSNFTITHAQARPKLVKMGFKVARETKEKSESYRKWEAVASKRPKDADKIQSWFKATVKAAGLSADMVDVIMKEDATHRAFNNERNYFDVTKYLYQRKVGTPGGTKVDVVKAKLGRPAKVDVVRVKAKLGRPAKVVVVGGDNEVESIKWLVSQGGTAAVEKKIADLHAEVTEMTSALAKAKAALTALASSAA